MLMPLPETEVGVPESIAGPDLAPDETFAGVLEEIRGSYYGARPSDQDLTYAAVRGMLGVLGDRYTRFLEPDEWRRMQEESGGEFGGVGIGIRANDRWEAEVASVSPGGSAARAGVKVKDILVKVGDVALDGSHAVSSRAQDLVRGPEGTHVLLWLRRARGRRLYSVSLVRQRIQVPTVRYRMAPGGVGVVALDSFGKHSDSEIEKALASLRKAGMRALVLDLRGNPGGLFESAIDISSRFVPSGTVVFTQDRDGKRMHIPSVPSKRYLPSMPLAVLVDHGSASASEIVAGAIQDTRAGLLVGTRTYGKAVVQTITPLKDGSAVLVTTHHYYTPRGTDIGSRGVEPDVYVSGDFGAKDTDPALHRAVSLLMTRVVSSGRPEPRHALRASRKSKPLSGLPS
jgi:carboxyl-terminal processing protease